MTNNDPKKELISVIMELSEEECKAILSTYDCNRKENANHEEQ